MLEILIVLSLLIVVLAVVLLLKLQRLPDHSAQVLEQQHRAMLADLHEGLNRQGDRLMASQTDQSERLRTVVSEELRATREALQALQLGLSQALSAQREAVQQQLSELNLALQAKQDALRSEMLTQTLARLA